MPSVAPFSNANAAAALSLTNDLAAGAPAASNSPASLPVRPGSLAGGQPGKDQPLPLAPQTKPTYSFSATTFVNDKGRGTQASVNGEVPLGEGGTAATGEFRVRHRNGGADAATDARLLVGVKTPIAPWLEANASAEAQFNLAGEGSSDVTGLFSGNLVATQALGSKTEVTGRLGVEYTPGKQRFTDNYIAELGAKHQVSDHVGFFGSVTGETGDGGSKVAASAGANVAVSDKSSFELKFNKVVAGVEAPLPSAGGGDGVALTFRQQLN